MPYFHDSNIRRADRDAESGVLRVWFKDTGGPFHLLDVPEALFERLCSASNRDKFFAEFIKDKFILRA